MTSLQAAAFAAEGPSLHVGGAGLRAQWHRVEERLLALSPERLGMLLGLARTRAGVSKTDVIRRLDWTPGPALLALFESGRPAVDRADLPALIRAYDVDLDQILPDRDALVVDLRRGRLRVGPRKVKVGRRASPDQVLAAYLDFVRSLRGTPTDSRIDPETLRVADIIELACALGMTARTVEARLIALLDADEHHTGSALKTGDRLPMDQGDVARRHL